MKYLIILLASLALVCTPLQAQPDVGDTAGDVADAVSRVGGTSNAIQMLFMVLLLVVAWRGLKPLIDSSRSSQEALLKRIEREDAVETQRELVRQSTAASLEKAADILSKLETAEQASQGRVSAVTELKEHVTAELQPVAQDMGQMRQTLDEAVGEIKKASQRLDELATKADLQTELSPIKQGLDALATRLTTLETHLAPPTAPPAPES